MHSMRGCKNCWLHTNSMEDEAMVDRGNVDKHRTSMSGLKVTEQSKWGHDKALERTKDYGGLRQVDMRPKDMSMPQGPEYKRGPDWSDDVSENSWLRGGGKGGEGKPNFQPGIRRL